MLSKKEYQKSKGITLIALVITIVVMLILAAVSIRLTLGKNGIVGKAKDAELLNKKAQYMEEINVAIADEQIERAGTHKEEAFITSLEKRLSPENKKWVKSTAKYCEENGSLTEKENDMDNNRLFITTIEYYEIIVDVDNNMPKAAVRDKFARSESEYTITYNANAGDDEVTGTVTNQTVKIGYSIKAKANSYERIAYAFTGWSKYPSGKNSNNVDEIYPEGANIEIDQDTVLYAQWQKVKEKVTFNSNGGTGKITALAVDPNTKITLPQNTFTRTGFEFMGWGLSSTQADNLYAPGTQITITQDTVVYAAWRIIIGTGMTLNYRNYNFVVYAKEGDLYYARPATHCGTFSSYAPSTTIENHISQTFGIPGKIQTDVFSLSVDDTNIVSQCGISSGHIWMSVSGYIRPTAAGFGSAQYGNAWFTAYLVPKLIIDSSIIAVDTNSNYARIIEN